MENNSYYQGKEQTTGSPKDNRYIIYAFLAAALLGTWGYLIYDKNKSSRLLENLSTQNTTVTNERNEVQELYNASLSRLDSLMGDNQILTDSLTNRNSEITNLRAEIRKVLYNKNATANDLARARQMIKELNGRIENLVEDVARLESDNRTLVATNERITAEKTKVEAQLDSNRKERMVLQKSLDETTDIASTLSVSSINIYALNEKSSGKEKETTSAKRADKLRITFNLDENRIAKSGNKEIFIAVTSPDGKSIATQEILTTREDGEKPIAAKVSVPYDAGRKTPVSFDWRSDNGFQTGDYRIEIYHNGYKIGEGIRSLKKSGLFG